mmetsp:Transcript_39976/g.89667  ORF Transcript_39976/g.89667 Transcript_39976/m.89667 type:complete len:243 (-) Transcript_39976:177-905(-)
MSGLRMRDLAPVSHCRTHLSRAARCFYPMQNPEAGARFDASMKAVSEYAAGPGQAARLFDWGLAGRAAWVVDVGGGTGALLAAILRAHPSLQRGTLVDQAQVVAAAAPVLEAAGVQRRCEVAAGSFFEAGSVPAGADVYVMKNIMHDWRDPECLQILRVVTAAMRPDSRLVILDMVRSARESYEPWNLDLGDYFDLNMLVTVGGVERTRAEWEALFKEAGLKLVSVAPGTMGGVSALETRPL